MKNLITLLIAVLGFLDTSAQSYEIRVVEKNGNELGVELRATSGVPSTSDFVTDLVFGIKWPQSCGTDLDLDLSTITTNFVMMASGTSKKSKTGYYYWAFGSFTPYNFPTNWALNEWVEIMAVKTNNSAGQLTCTFEICETGFDETTGPNFGVNLVDYTPLINQSGAVLVVMSPCSANVLTINETPVVPYSYQAIQSVISTGTVAAGTTVEYKAGVEILLEAGFEVVIGSSFFARIEGCVD